jgi:hypothetical protein
MGRTFLDIDMQRAADLLGMERRQAESIRDLQRGQFLALGPAITRRPLSVRIGGVQTRSRAVSTGLAPPSVTGDDLHACSTPRRRPRNWRRRRPRCSPVCRGPMPAN